jgi:hypothetical protein
MYKKVGSCPILLKSWTTYINISFDFTRISIMTLTYVTAYLNISGKTTVLNRTNEWRFEYFRQIATTGVSFCVFVGNDVYSDFMELANLYPNLHVMPPVQWAELPIVQECMKYEELKLPETRHKEKDTAEYMMLINSKPYFVQEAMKVDPWKTTHFAWIDFSIAHVIRNVPASQDSLRYLSKRSWKRPFFAIPGCWSPLTEIQHPHFLNHIQWRFCGGFFIGDRASMERFVQEYPSQFRDYLSTYRTITWEVNVWAWMESRVNKEIWSPIWYKADHNDSIIQLPPNLTIDSLDIEKEYTLDYTNLDGYSPSSPSYVQDYSGRHWMSTRCVNYSLNPDGCYNFLDNGRIIKTRNMVTELFFDYNGNPVSMEPSREMLESSIHMRRSTTYCPAEGLEDIRLYNVQDRIRFIASTMNYSLSGRIQIAVGDYLPESMEYRDCMIIEAPSLDSRVEKNWTPFVREKEEEWFIYKWCPMELGKIIVHEDGMAQLVIQERIETAHIPWFSQFRGSTPLQLCEKGWVCVVHFSEEGGPRKYYHCLVWLNLHTLKPIQYSDPFYFKHSPIEFCVGMKILDESNHRFAFWISQMDRNPLIAIGSPARVHRIE